MPSEKEKSFALFDTGLRPFQIYDQIKVKKHTLYFYYEEYKKLKGARELEIGDIEKEAVLQLEAEEAEERAKQEAEILQQEASERAARQQQELKPLTDKLHSVEATLEHIRWFPRSLPMDWLLFGNAYASPKEYQEALKKHRDALRITIEEVKSRQALTIGG